MEKLSKPRFRIVASLVLMIPSFLLFLKLYGVVCDKEYLSLFNGELFDCLMGSGFTFQFFFLLVVFAVGTILLLTTVYKLDEEQEKLNK